MIQQYQITNHLVDLARNQIIRDQGLVDEFIQTLPPKTMMVLTELAKSPGQVVNHDQLMDVVWQNTVVSPNSIQRCITQLRKALADDSKQQRIIKTHAKQGYSLEVPVQFIQKSAQALTLCGAIQPGLAKELSKQSTPIQGVVSLKSAKDLPKLIIVSVSLFILIVVIYSYFSISSRDFSFNTLTPITSSDNLERNASYSPDGKFVLFHRYDGLCDNNIWAKELATAKEHKLTTKYGFYSNHSFTENGEKLAFMAKVSCKDNNKQQACWNLMTLDFAKALKQAQQPVLTASCDQGDLANPVWLKNGNIAALNKQNARWQIVKFMPGAPSFVPLYASLDKNYYHLVYSVKRKALIAIAINSQNEHVIDLISPQGELLSSHLIERLSNISRYQLIEPIIDPQQQEQLLFSTGKRLFSLSFDGKMEQVSTLKHNYLSTIKMNNLGQDIVTVQGVIDTDIAKVNLENVKLNEKQGLAGKRSEQKQAVGFNQVHQPYPSIARSIAEDFDAKFQPKGELIAFISTRSGTSQIWIQNQDQLTQLTHLPIDTNISSFSWAPSGVSIMLTSNAEIFHVFLDKSIEKIAMEFAVLDLYQWQENNDLLMSVRQAGQPQVINYNLTSNKSTTLIEHAIKWVVKLESNQLLHIDSNNKFWLTKANQAQQTEQIEKLNGQFGSRRLILEDGNVYSINKHKQLWLYTPETDSFKILGDMDSYTHLISDIRQSELLLTQTIAAKKEVVVLSN